MRTKLYFVFVLLMASLLAAACVPTADDISNWADAVSDNAPAIAEVAAEVASDAGLNGSTPAVANPTVPALPTVPAAQPTDVPAPTDEADPTDTPDDDVTATPEPEPTDEPAADPTEVPATATDEPVDDDESVFDTVDTGTMPELPIDASHDGWTISLNEEIDSDPIVRDWLTRLQAPAPELWETYPNVPNDKVNEFRVVNVDQVPDGLEYGVATVPFCEQDETCNFVVPAWHYRLITADYEFLSEQCRNEDKDNRRGCVLVLLNVGGETMIWRDQIADSGFSVPGRYWNGDKLEWGVWGLVSHVSANMLNYPTQGLVGEMLNSGSGGNAGANCGIPGGCPVVDVLVVVSAGDRILATARTTVER